MNVPASGGRVPDVAGAFGTKPTPVTVTVSPLGSRPAVFDTVTVGAGVKAMGVKVSNGAYFAPPPG